MSLALDEPEGGARCGALSAVLLQRRLALDSALALNSQLKALETPLSALRDNPLAPLRRASLILEEPGNEARCGALVPASRVGYGTVVSLIRMRLARVIALELDEGMVAAVASQLAALSEQAGILPFFSRERRSSGVAMPEALPRAFCLGLHICFGKGDLGSQGT